MSEHYHDYERVSENSDGRVEVCKICRKRLIIKKDNKGRIDNQTYAREHIRDLAQPNGPTAKVFAQLYGKPKI